MISSNTAKIMLPALAETGWQVGAQYLDKRFAKDWIGVDGYKIAGSDLTAILYPVFFGLLVWQAAAYMLTAPNLTEDEKKTQEKGAAELGRNVCLAMAGWTLGYYVAGYFGLGTFATAAAVGIGIAVPGFMMNSWRHATDKNSVNTKANIALTGAAVFAAGFLWYVDYLIPSLVGGDKLTHELMKSVVSPIMTLMTTAACLYVAIEGEKKLVNHNNNKPG